MKKNLLATLLICTTLATHSQTPVTHQHQPIEAVTNASAITQLLSRLDLDQPGLEKVKGSANDPATAADELLKYYRNRTSVKHPLDKQAKSEMLGKAAVEKDLTTADNALQHVFVGQGAYPPHFCGDDINWATSPVPDNEWRWQLNRMNFWGALGRAYWHTGDEKYAKEWSAQLVDWISKNPRDTAHQYAWRSIEAGIRGHSWTEHFQRFIYSPWFTPQVLVAYLNSCFDHAEYLMTKYSKGSNWALMEAEGMGFIAITFPEFAASRKWRDEATRRLNEQIHTQVYADGHQRELAFGYHVGCIDWFLNTYNLAMMNGLKDAFSPSYTSVIEKMCEVPMKLSFPNGTTPQFGDSWTGSPGQHWNKLRQWSGMFNRPDFLYVATKGAEGTRPNATAFALKESGLYSMRSNWTEDAICMVLKNGQNGGAHCQPDNGTFELYAGGRNLMPDAGSYIYSGDPVNRNWFRQTRVHQTVTLNGANSAYAPRLLLWKPANDVDMLVVENGSYQNLTHRRSVFFVDKKFFVIVDDAYGDGAGDVDLHFQLAPGKAVFDNKNFLVHSAFGEGWNVMVQTLPQNQLKLEEEEGQVSFQYTKKELRPAFRYRVQKQASQTGVRFITVVAPYQQKLPKVSVKLIGNPSIAASQIQLEVQADGNKQKLAYDLSLQNN